MKENFTFSVIPGVSVLSPPGNTSRYSAGTVFSDFRTLTLSLLCLTLMVFSFVSRAQNPGVTLEQGGNGAFNNPTNPVEWQRGNLNPTKAHFIESYAVPYRVIMTDLPVNQEVKLTIGYDTKHSGRQALDFLIIRRNRQGVLQVA